MIEAGRKNSQVMQSVTAEKGRLQAPGRWRKLPLFWFLLFLSYECTRRCPSCYAFNQVGDGHPLEMDDATFDRLLEWIPAVWQQNGVRANVINFLGGEPLLRTDRIKAVMDAVSAGTGGIKGLVNTNGDLVDAVNWDHLEHIRWIAVNITDTPIDELDRRMRIIRARSNVTNQTLSAVLDDDNLDRIAAVSRFGIENGYRLRFNKNIFKGNDTAYRRRLLKKYHELCDLFEHYIVRGYTVNTTFLFDTLIPAWDSETSPYPCGKRIATVFPDGAIGPCIRDHDYKTGTIFDPDPLNRLRCDTFHFEVQQADIPDACRVCASRTACQGGCPRDKLLLNGCRAGRSVACEIHSEIIPRLRELEYLQDGSGRTPIQL